MLTKDQALAVMDAQIIRVEAERRRRLERRVGRFRVMFPILRQVPLEDIGELVEQARRHTVRQWTVYLVAAAYVAVACWFLLLQPWLGLGPSAEGGYFAWYFLGMVTIVLTVHLHIRAYLRRVIPLKYAKSLDRLVIPDA